MRVQAVFFDVGNTLLYPYPSVASVVREVLAQAGFTRELDAIDEMIPTVEAYYEDRYREDDTFWTDEAETSGVWVGMYSLLCRRLGVEDVSEAIARRVYDEFGFAHRWRAYDDVVPALGRLAERGIKTGIISNWDRRLRQILVGLGLHGLLDAVISSAMVGLHKPDPRIFMLACERVGVQPEESVHVGDHYYADVLGATVSGMRPVLIDRRGAEAPRGVESLDTLDRLEEVLGLDD